MDTTVAFFFFFFFFLFKINLQNQKRKMKFCTNTTKSVSTHTVKYILPLYRQREKFWIRELDTAAPYGCNDKTVSVGNLTSPRCSSVNVMKLFGSSQRRKRSHGIGTTIVLIFMLMLHLTLSFHMYSSH